MDDFTRRRTTELTWRIEDASGDVTGHPMVKLQALILGWLVGWMVVGSRLALDGAPARGASPTCGLDTEQSVWAANWAGQRWRSVLVVWRGVEYALVAAWARDGRRGW